MRKLLRNSTIPLLLFATSASAQSRSLVDSVLLLNRAGRWAEAAQLARKSIPATASADERCTLRVSMLWGLVQLRMLDIAASELKTYDTECARFRPTPQYASEIAAIRAETNLPPLPKTGFDFSYLEPFWTIVDSLSRDIQPSDSLWRRLTRSVGFRLADQPQLPRDLALAIMPSQRARRDSVIARQNDNSAVLTHLATAATMRVELTRLADSIKRSASAGEPVRLAAKYLPVGGTSHRDPPLIAFAIFRDDAFSQEKGIIVDLLNVRRNGLTPLLAHEFHHDFLAALSKVDRPPRDSADAALVNILINFRNEGIADQIDKSYPLKGSSGFVREYNAAYARTPAVIRQIDSLLGAMDGSPNAMRATGSRVTALLPFNGHPNGAYVAREIIETFGIDSIMPAVRSPFAFLRTFASAEKKRGKPSPFSAASQRVLDVLEKKYTRR